MPWGHVVLALMAAASCMATTGLEDRAECNASLIEDAKNHTTALFSCILDNAFNDTYCVQCVHEQGLLSAAKNRLLPACQDVLGVQRGFESVNFLWSSAACDTCPYNETKGFIKRVDVIMSCFGRNGNATCTECKSIVDDLTSHYENIGDGCSHTDNVLVNFQKVQSFWSAHNCDNVEFKNLTPVVLVVCIILGLVPLFYICSRATPKCSSAATSVFGRWRSNSQSAPRVDDGSWEHLSSSDPFAPGRMVRLGRARSADGARVRNGRSFSGQEDTPLLRTEGIQ